MGRVRSVPDESRLGGRPLGRLALACLLLAIVLMALLPGSAAAAPQLVRVQCGSIMECKFINPGYAGQIFTIETFIDVTGDVDDGATLYWVHPDSAVHAEIDHTWHYLQYDEGLSMATVHRLYLGETPPAGDIDYVRRSVNLSFTVAAPAVLEFHYKLTDPVITATKHCYVTAGLWSSDTGFVKDARLLNVAPENWSSSGLLTQSFTLTPGQYYVLEAESEGGFGYVDGAAAGAHRVEYSAVIREGEAPVVQMGADATLVEGAQFTSSGSFSDPDPDTWTATVDYGDGSGAQPLALGADKTFALSHLYRDDGSYTVTVSVNETGGYSDTGTCVVNVNNAAPVLGTMTGLPTTWVLSETTLSPSATFGDAGTLDTHAAVWNWGDGTSSDGAVAEAGGSGTVTGSHTYASPGSYTVTLTVTDADGGSTAATYTVLIANTESLINSLMGRIQNRGDLGGHISGSFKSSLLASLPSALRALEDGHTSTADRILSDLLKQVKTQKRSGGIAADAATAVSAALGDILSALHQEYSLYGGLR